MKGEYNIKALPTEGKDWLEADKIEIVLNLDVGEEQRTFKGIISLHGIRKVYKEV